MSVEYSRADQSDHETTTVPLLESMEDREVFIPFDQHPESTEEIDCRFEDYIGSTEETDSLEGHVTYIKQPSPRFSPARIIFSRQAMVVALIVILALVITCIVLGVILVATPKPVKWSCPTSTQYCLTEGCIDTVQHMVHSINDNGTEPCTDFFAYACGGWAKNNPIPSSKSFWGVYSVLSEENQSKMRTLVNNPSLNKTTSKAVMKAKTFYDVCLDEELIDKLGAKPLQDLIKDIGGWNITGETSDSQDFLELLKQVQALQAVPAFFSMDVDVDDKNSSRNIIKIDQRGLALSRTNYLKNETRKNETDKELVAYLDYMSTVGVLLGGERNATKKKMREVMQLEMDLAEIFSPPENRSQVDQMYTKLTLNQLQKLCPSIPWLKFCQAMFKGITEITESEEVVVFAKEYLNRLTNVIHRVNKTILANYMVWQVVHRMVPSLSIEFRRARLNLEKVLYGTSEAEDRWKTCMSSTDAAIGMALGKLFVEAAFQESSKNAATDMIDAIRTAFKQNLPLLKWMDEKTRKAAEDKADAVVNMIGYPPYIKDPKKLDEKYEGLIFVKGQYFQNKRKAAKFHHSRSMKNLRKPVDKYKWYMKPQTVNAYYSPSRNQIVFPAGILQAPYYDKARPKVVNFGSMGAVVGHELTHGFDNSGRTYDKYGNLGVPWWTNQSVTAFQNQTRCMIDQYSKYSYFGEHVNGKHTLGENIADNGGLKAAYTAYKDWVTKHGDELPLPVLGKTNDQIFFVAYAQTWCANIREARAKVALSTDPHSPNRFRVLGALSNSQEFAKAFNCPLNSAMNPAKKCQIW